MLFVLRRHQRPNFRQKLPSTAKPSTLDVADDNGRRLSLLFTPRHAINIGEALNLGFIADFAAGRAARPAHFLRWHDGRWRLAMAAAPRAGLAVYGISA